MDHGKRIMCLNYGLCYGGSCGSVLPLAGKEILNWKMEALWFCFGGSIDALAVLLSADHHFDATTETPQNEPPSTSRTTPPLSPPVRLSLKSVLSFLEFA
jgi:hypothetical protein